MESGKEFFRAATCFLVAALKQVPGLGVAIDIWDNMSQKAKMGEQEEKVQSLVDRIAQLEKAAQMPSQDARQIALETIEDLRKEGQAIDAEKAEAIADIMAVMPANIHQKAHSAIQTFHKTGSSQYLSLPLGSQAATQDRQEFYVSLIPKRRPRWRHRDEFEDRKSWYFDSLLGMGGFGEVWKIKHKTLPKYQAVKFCLDPKSSLILKREEHIIANLPTHKNIVNVLDSNIEKEPYWIAFEYVEGGTLEKHILGFHGPMLLTEVLRLLHEIGEGLACAHAIPLVHRDLKPANVLLTSEGVPKISDFGLSKILQQDVAASNTMQMSMRQYGTWAWMSPEQREGEVAHPSDDVYSLAVLAYQMLLGNPNKEPPRHYRRELENLPTPVPAPYLDLLSDCIDRPRGERPADAKIFLERLSKIEKDLASSAEKIAATPAKKPAEKKESIERGAESKPELLTEVVKKLSKKQSPPPSRKVEQAFREEQTKNDSPEKLARDWERLAESLPGASWKWFANVCVLGLLLVWASVIVDACDWERELIPQRFLGWRVKGLVEVLYIFGASAFAGIFLYAPRFTRMIAWLNRCCKQILMWQRSSPSGTASEWNALTNNLPTTSLWRWWIFFFLFFLILFLGVCAGVVDNIRGEWDSSYNEYVAYVQDFDQWMTTSFSLLTLFFIFLYFFYLRLEHQLGKTAYALAVLRDRHKLAGENMRDPIVSELDRGGYWTGLRVFGRILLFVAGLVPLFGHSLIGLFLWPLTLVALWRNRQNFLARSCEIFAEECRRR